jgi:predicted nucleotidyltransferase component of viral defense system
MNIQEIIRECVVALFSNEILKRTLVLKGGTALILIEKIDTRLSVDIDFSIADEIKDPEKYFSHVAEVLKNHFIKFGYEVFDTKYSRRPKERAESKPKFWGGWSFEFKLIDKKAKPKNIESKRRFALVPDGAASSKISIEISEYEYCDSTENVEIDGSYVISYSTVLLILEKLRAICQQHPNYSYGKLRNRARDYFDIYQLIKKHRSTELYQELKHHLPQVFAAKDVPLSLLKEIFQPSFIEFQAAHFKSVEATVKEKMEPFEFYLEQLRLLISDLGY